MKIAVIGALQEGQDFLLGCRAILVGSGSPWKGGWYGSRARIYRDGLHRLEGVALIGGSAPREVAAHVMGCPYPVLLVGYGGNQGGRGYQTLKAAVNLRRGMGQEVKLYHLTPWFGTWLEVVEGKVIVLGSLLKPARAKVIG